MRYKALLVAGTALLVAGCTADTPLSTPAALLSGPPVQAIKTPYDDALQCLRPLSGAMPRRFTLAVGDVADRTGKMSLDEGGTGNFVTQGAGDIVTSALMKSGVVNVVERLDTRVLLFEQKQAMDKLLGDGMNRVIQLPNGQHQEVPYRGIRPGAVRGSDFYILGSINSLDFGVVSNGAEAIVAGIGPRARQFRAVVGLDLRLVHTESSRVVANTSLQKQIIGTEVGFGVGRFFGDTLVEVDIGEKRNEPLQMALRSMLQLATFNLITDLYGIQGCREGIDALERSGQVSETTNQGAPEPPPAPPPAAQEPPTALHRDETPRPQ
ncbi:CsgG/HfaB family protein [Azospirillum sp. ST 5-10]|uniref:CsgG/HfaB family protein n=1 Tax=unclassified Azospirillum TaxID=2630922 RepID=UPI003F4A2E9C